MFERLSKKTKKQFEKQKKEEGELSQRYNRGDTTIMDTHSNIKHEQVYIDGYNKNGKLVDTRSRIANGEFSQAQLEEEIRTANKLKGVRKEILFIERGI